MIDRYSITVSADIIRERFSVDVPEFYKAHYNAAPTQLLPVITSASPQGLSLYYWGTSPAWSRDRSLTERSINIRTEFFPEKPALRRALVKNRCVIPADGFYGWKKVGKKTIIPYRFVLKKKEPFGIAGMWEEFEDTEGNEIQTFTLVTQPANELVAGIQERMPVILNKQNEKLWLHPEAGEAALLDALTPIAATAMDHYPVSPAIKDSHADFPSMIIPTPPADQHGNLTLFD